MLGAWGGVFRRGLHTNYGDLRWLLPETSKG